MSAFVDTNILVYARDAGAGEKQRRAAALLAELWHSRQGRVSVQVLNEYFVTVTRKLRPGLAAAAAWEDVEALRAWHPVALDWALMARARELSTRFSLSWWDALIVAAAVTCGADTLYTEDLSPGQRLDGVAVVNPFLAV